MSKHQNVRFLGVVLAMAAPIALGAPLNLKLGLWQTTTVVDIHGMMLPSADLEKVPPAQRARVEAMMRQRSAAGPRTHTTKGCLTAEKLAMPFGQQINSRGANCTYTALVATATRQDYRIACTGATSSHGQIHIRALSPQLVKASVKMDTGSGSMASELTARWLQGDCGDSK
jgi:hypothetical protein